MRTLSFLKKGLDIETRPGVKRKSISIFSHYLITVISYDQKTIFYCISFY